MNRIVIVVGGLLAVQSALAAEYKVDADHSNVGFTVRHLVSKVSGGFKEFDGSFTFDEKKPTDSKVNFTVQTKSVDTNNDKRDEHLRSDDFFATDKNPAMTFVGKKLTAAGKGKFKLAGDLTLKGVTKPVTFNVEYMGAAKDPWGNDKVGFVATSKIKRKDFGMTWNKALDAGGVVLGDDVEINLQIEANKAKAPESGDKK